MSTLEQEIYDFAEEYEILGETPAEIMTNARDQIILGLLEEEEYIEDLFERYYNAILRANMK